MKKVYYVVIFCLVPPLLGMATEIMPLKHVKPGMRGFGLTVFEHNQIEPFEIEIIDVVRNYYPQRNLILIKLIGDRVKYTGVVSGMSGSPIYIDQKLTGALAYRMGTFMKDALAGVTPIEEMLAIFAREKIRDQEIDATAQRISGLWRDYFKIQDSQRPDLSKLLQLQQQPMTQGMQPIETPLVMTGLVPSVYEKINHQFNQNNFVILPGGQIDTTGTGVSEEIQPGSAVAATIISGDFNISAMGTVTYLEDNKVLAFGHPFLNSGAVNIPLAKAKVITTFSSLYASNKFGVATAIIGNIRQDRSTGIMGVVGEIPPMIPVSVKVSSSVLAQKQYQFKIINDRSTFGVMPVFLWTSLVNALESARLGTGDYALKLTGRIMLENSADIILDNFYSGGGAGYYDNSGLDITEAAYDIVMTLGALLTNEFEVPRIKNIELEFYAQPGRRRAEIERIICDKQQVQPGDSLNLVILLRPYQDQKIEIKKRILIPKNLIAGSLILAVGGPHEITNWEQQAGIGKFKPVNYPELISVLNRKRKNTHILIQLKILDTGAILHGREFSTLPPSIYGLVMQNKSHQIFEPLKEKVIAQWVIPLEFDIRGGKQFNLTVKPYSGF